MIHGVLYCRKVRPQGHRQGLRAQVTRSTGTYLYGGFPRGRVGITDLTARRDLCPPHLTLSVLVCMFAGSFAATIGPEPFNAILARFGGPKAFEEWGRLMEKMAPLSVVSKDAHHGPKACCEGVATYR